MSAISLKTVKSLPIILWQNQPVITTELLASVYDVKVIQIQQNFKNNTDRFIEGTHFFKLTGSDLKAFKNRLENIESVEIGKNANALILWTERGTVRHAKMLGTDKAWEVQDELETFYFANKTKTEPTSPPLPTYPTPEQRETLVNTIKQLSSITADLTKVVIEGDYIAKGEPEQEPTLSMPDYFPLLVFSKATLEHLAEKVDNAIKIKTAEERKKLIAKIHVLAKELAKKSNIGVRFYDLEARKKELPVQYRNPENPSQTWRGRGIMPLWLQDKIANGHQKEDFKETSKEHDNV